MKTYTCDKCGSLIKSRTADNLVIMPHLIYGCTDETTMDFNNWIDLCDACMADLRAWITGVEE